MAGSKGVQTRSEASKGGGVKTRTGGVKTRGGRCDGGGRSNGGRSSGGRSSGGVVISAPGGSNNRPSTDSRGKGVAAESGGKGKAVDVGGSSNHRDDGDGTPPAPKATRRPSSSHSSNPSGQLSPPSQGTPQSGNVSVSRTIPLQYPPSSCRVESLSSLRQQLQVQNHDEEEEEEEPEDAEEEDDDDVEPDDIEPEEEDGDDLHAVNGEDVDYDQLLADVMADPGRQSLPLLSEQPHPERDTIW